MEQDEGLQDMAQMMGFSAFGSQDHPQKKRRYNPSADSFTARQPPQATTSSNSIPLGPPPVPKPPTNVDEIDLEDDQDSSPAVKESVPVEPVSEPGTNSLPRRPAVGADQAGSRPHHHGPGSGHENRGGKPWYEGYYDSLSNENPWHRLEKAMNLQPIGGV